MGIFKLSARISSESLDAIKPLLERIVSGKGTVKETEQGMEINAELEGESARALNRMLLSELRRAEKHTRLRSEWTSGGVTEKFFDYAPKGTLRA